MYGDLGTGITWKGGGGWKIRGWTQEKRTTREGGLDVKYNTYRGALIFHSFLQTGKVVEESLEFRYRY